MKRSSSHLFKFWRVSQKVNPPSSHWSLCPIAEAPLTWSPAPLTGHLPPQCTQGEEGPQSCATCSLPSGDEWAKARTSKSKSQKWNCKWLITPENMCIPLLVIQEIHIKTITHHFHCQVNKQSFFKALN